MKILIGYDGSASSDQALKDLLAAGLPDIVEARVLSVADVFIPPPISNAEELFPPLIPAGIRRAQERAEQKLNEARSLATKAAVEVRKSFPNWRVQEETLADSPTWAIIRIAEEWQPDLIALGSHGHSVLGGRLILGSVSQRVLYEALCSVRIARLGEASTDPSFRIIIGLDGSPDSLAAVTEVGQRNWPKGTEVRLLSIVESVIAVSADATDQSELDTPDLGGDDNSGEILKYFEPVAERLRSAGLPTSIKVRQGNPKNELVEEARRWNADNIFLGARGLRGIERLLLGSVSASVAASAQCSVEVVRTKA